MMEEVLVSSKATVTVTITVTVVPPPPGATHRSLLPRQKHTCPPPSTTPPTNSKPPPPHAPLPSSTNNCVYFICARFSHRRPVDTKMENDDEMGAFYERHRTVKRLCLHRPRSPFRDHAKRTLVDAIRTQSALLSETLTLPSPIPLPSPKVPPRRWSAPAAGLVHPKGLGKDRRGVSSVEVNRKCMGGTGGSNTGVLSRRRDGEAWGYSASWRVVPWRRRLGMR